MTKATKATKSTTKATTTTTTTTTTKDFNDIKKQCNDYIAESFTKSTEATAMLRASVILYTIKSGYNYGLKDIINDLPNLNNYGEKTQKNLMRFAKDIRKNKRYTGKLSLESLKNWCLQQDIRAFYDSLVNPNRKKASSTQASSTQASSTQASSTQASSTQASSTQASSTQASSTQASSTQASSTQASSTQASSTQASVDAVKMFVEDSNLADLKRAYILIASRLGIKLDEKQTKAILDIKKIAC